MEVLKRPRRLDISMNKRRERGNQFFRAWRRRLASERGIALPAATMMLMIIFLLAAAAATASIAASGAYDSGAPVRALSVGAAK